MHQVLKLNFCFLSPKREVLLQLRESTKASLESETDAATVLHLVCTLLFYYSTNHFLNSPGRCVPNILEYIKADLADENLYIKLVNFQSNFLISSCDKMQK